MLIGGIRRYSVVFGGIRWYSLFRHTRLVVQVVSNIFINQSKAARPILV